MAGLNKVIIIGNVGTDPEMRFTPNGSPVTSFRIATSRIYSSSEGERKQETEWFDVITWNRLAENCNQFLTKGQKAYIEGRLRTRTWEGQDGQRRTRVEIIANTVLFLDKRPQGTGAAAEPGTEVAASEDEVEPGDIPF